MLLNPKDIPLSEMPFIGSIETVLCHLLLDDRELDPPVLEAAIRCVVVATGLLSP